MHRGHCYHRDIAPDNILLLDDGTPLLLDFGAARRVIGDATHALTAFLKPGYAPVEQYAEMPSMKQGPWTDLYALGSVVHYAITGRTPPESVARLVNDTMVPLLKAGRRPLQRAFPARDRPRAGRAPRAIGRTAPPRCEPNSASKSGARARASPTGSRRRRCRWTAPASAGDGATVPPIKSLPALKPLLAAARRGASRRAAAAAARSAPGRGWSSDCSWRPSR